MRAAASKCRAGFTLIELLLAISIFAAVMTAIYASWTAVVRGTKAGLEATADVHRARVAGRALETSLTSAALFTANLEHYQFLADSTGDFAYLSFVSRLPASFPGSGIFGDLVMRRVTFTVDGKQQLVMTQAPYLLDTNANQEPYSLVLAKNVKLFSLAFWDTNSTEVGWTDEWLHTNRLPPMVKYALASGASDRPEAKLDSVASVISIPASAVGAEVQVPGGAGARTLNTPPNQPNKPPPANSPGTINSPGQQPPNQLPNRQFGNPFSGQYIPPGNVPGNSPRGRGDAGGNNPNTAGFTDLGPSRGLRPNVPAYGIGGGAFGTNRSRTNAPPVPPGPFR